MSYEEQDSSRTMASKWQLRSQTGSSYKAGLFKSKTYAATAACNTLTFPILTSQTGHQLMLLDTDYHLQAPGSSSSSTDN
eukprot:jgi/Chrzof1/11909/Cz06g14090.t1